MLKRIVKFFKARAQIKHDASDLFARRFGEGYTDRDQWNGGRHVSTKELRNLNKETGTKLTARHVS